MGAALGPVGGHAVKVAGHAAVGCAAAAASGGSCKGGALSGAVGAAATPFVNTGTLVGNTAALAVVGGLAAVAGGDKFQNGAVTAAFGYLFNECSSKGCWTTQEERALVDQGDFLGYYTKACEGGDQYACFARTIASGQQPGATMLLYHGLQRAGYSFEAATNLVKNTIPLLLAQEYADYLSASQDMTRFPRAVDIAELHWDVLERTTSLLVGLGGLFQSVAMVHSCCHDIGARKSPADRFKSRAAFVSSI